MSVTIQCPCPLVAGAVQHPDGDTVTLREHLDFRSALAIRNDFVLARSESEVTPGEALALLTEGYLLHGIEAWTLTDVKGRPLPVSKTAIREALLSRPELIMDLADAADALYGPPVILPLLVRAARSSQPMPTVSSTSAPKASSPTPPTPSSPSSTTTSPTADIETTLAPLVGASSS